MLDNSRAPFLLTQSHLKALLPLDELEADCVVVCLDEVDLAEQPTENPLVCRQAKDLAYVIYTSGSTGKPKGVSLPQAALVNLLYWQSGQPSLNQAEKTLQFTTLSFDVSFQEIFGTYLNGGQLVLVDEETRRDASALLKYLSKQQIERLFVPYVMLQHLAEQVSASHSETLSLQNIITAGEQLRITPAIHRLFNMLPHCRLHNHYGPSESHVVTACTLSLDKESWKSLPPIGQPIANTRIYILDSAHHPLPPGIPGELCIAGAGLARGYLNRPELTAEKFIQVELFGKTERIYTTGDLARWLPDGNLEYLGRIDHQVKVRGFRIELGEIEAALTLHEKVRKAAVVVYEREGNRALAAYITVRNNDEVSMTSDDRQVSAPFTTEVKDHLKECLPDYMIPTYFTVLDRLPLTPNGKVDRKALEKRAAEEGFVTDTSLYVAPQTEEEEWLADIFAEVLGVERVGMKDNFFELGGNSLLAGQLLSRIRNIFPIEISFQTLFQKPTPIELIEHIASDAGTDARQASPIGIRFNKPDISDETAVPISLNELEFWFIELKSRKFSAL